VTPRDEGRCRGQFVGDAAPPRCRLLTEGHAHEPEPDHDRPPRGKARAGRRAWDRARRVAGSEKPERGRLGSRRQARRSKRPAQTVTPLVDALWPGPERALRFNTSIPRDAVARFAAAIMAAEGVVLVSWEHRLLPAAVAALPNAPETPAKWPVDRFDVVWVLTRRARGWDFQQVPQLLFPHDRDTVVPFSPAGAD
jgi:hypothetical protein